MGTVWRRTYKSKDGKKRTLSVWWIKYRSHGRVIRESSESVDFEEAKNFLRKREGESATKGPIHISSRRITFAELAQDEINDYTVNGQASINDLKTRLDLHILPFFGSCKAVKIRVSDIKSYIVRRQEEGAMNGTINRELTVIRRAFNLALQSEKIATAPYIELLKENNVRKGFFEREQLEAVLKKLEGDGRDRERLRPMLRFAYITGWRIRSEVRHLKWLQVDFDKEEVRLEPGETKNGEGRVFPFTEELRQILEEQRATKKALEKDGKICPYVFHKKNGEFIGDFKHAWTTACEAAGLPGRIPHDFRRSAVRNLVRAGVPETVAMKMTGHKTRSVFDRYNITSDADLVTAAQKLDAYSRRAKFRAQSAKRR
jgi:integrase